MTTDELVDLLAARYPYDRATVLEVVRIVGPEFPASADGMLEVCARTGEDPVDMAMNSAEFLSRLRAKHRRHPVAYAAGVFIGWLLMLAAFPWILWRALKRAASRVRRDEGPATRNEERTGRR